MKLKSSSSSFPNLLKRRLLRPTLSELGTDVRHPPAPHYYVVSMLETWGVDTLLGSMRSIHFDVQGFSRTYWDLFVAAGFSVGVLYLFAGVLAWQLGGLPAETLAVMRVTVWALALCFAVITVVSWRYLFIIPIAFSIAVTVCLTAAAWMSAKQSAPLTP